MDTIKRYFVIVSYDGSNYAGWQKQPHMTSIQEIIEHGLAQIQQELTSIVASGRTDAKVHAIHQVFHFDTAKSWQENEWKRALNAVLPQDIRIQEVYQVNKEAHARFMVKEKQYDYYICEDMNNPFVNHYMYKIPYQVDDLYMQECANILKGTHDFTSFTSNKIHPEKSRIKTIHNIKVSRNDKVICITYQGDGFLRYMIRMITQTLIEAGRHQLTKQDIQKMLDAKNKHVCRYKAEACGLYLTNVIYEEEKIKCEK